MDAISGRTIAKQLGISTQRVSQLERTALAKMKKRLLKTIPEADLREFARGCGREKDPYQMYLMNMED